MRLLQTAVLAIGLITAGCGGRNQVQGPDPMEESCMQVYRGGNMSMPATDCCQALEKASAGLAICENQGNNGPYLRGPHGLLSHLRGRIFEILKICPKGPNFGSDWYSPECAPDYMMRCQLGTIYPIEKCKKN